MIRTIRFHVFTHLGIQYRAKIIDGELSILCRRYGVDSAWRTISRPVGRVIWTDYQLERKAA